MTSTAIIGGADKVNTPAEQYTLLIIRSTRDKLLDKFTENCTTDYLPNSDNINKIMDLLFYNYEQTIARDYAEFYDHIEFRFTYIIKYQSAATTARVMYKVAELVMTNYTDKSIYLKGYSRKKAIREALNGLYKAIDSKMKSDTKSKDEIKSKE